MLQGLYNQLIDVIFTPPPLYLSFTAAPYAPRLALFHLLDWRWVGFSTFQSWMVATALFCNAFTLAVALRLIVQRAKKCLDYAATAYFLHLVATAAFSGFPTHIAW